MKRNGDTGKAPCLEYGLHSVTSPSGGRFNTACESCDLSQEFEKPSPPQKPLPADPLGRSSQLGRSSLAAHLPAPGSAPTILQTNRSG